MNTDSICFPCKINEYCDGLYGYAITPTMDLTYLPGRKIMKNVNMYQIYFGDFGPEGDKFKELLDYYSDNIGSSDYYSIMTKHYYQNISGQISYITDQVKFVKSVSVNTTQTTGTVKVTDLLEIVGDLLAKGDLPDGYKHNNY